MGEPQEELTPEEEEEEEEVVSGTSSSSPYVPPYRQALPGRERLLVQKSNVCSRAYFVVVMVFFHVYILNVIALLLYVHYNSGGPPGDESPPPSSPPSGPPLPSPPDPDQDPEADGYRRSFSLPRIEGIRVGHVQRVSLMPDQTHQMKTLSLKPLLFGEYHRYISVSSRMSPRFTLTEKTDKHHNIHL
ncbi:hypothetical protein NHX12_013334 [Muraenolepis orangiensis]|uniref:Uncharacterized protein n=1 Tax=Muraenolepis orangiensis TaxID=630683 RepID=A0A9Q0DEF1_9TELE|nr:hypothetical protein NHX12_013334 [Muraenolepis orangiensis]